MTGQRCGKRWQIAAGLALLIALTGIPMMVQADDPQPGSAADPLIAKSYLDQVLPQALAPYATRAEVETLAAAPSYQVVTVPAGSILLAEGGTEIILRGGAAVAITTQLGGIADVTAGGEVVTGQYLPANHLLIVPRSDGRGFLSETDVTALVRGPYQIR